MDDPEEEKEKLLPEEEEKIKEELAQYKRE